MTRTVRRWGAITWLILRGLLAGYVAYLPLLAITQHLLYGRVDEERFFYSLFDPLLLPYLAWPPLWKAIGEVEGGAEPFLISAGSGLLVAGAVISLWLGLRAKAQMRGISGLGL